MREFFAKLTGTGQMTIPVEVRRYLGLQPGDRIAFIIGDDGRVQVRPVPVPTIESIRGAAGTVPQQLAWDEMLDTSHVDRLLEWYGQRD